MSNDYGHDPADKLKSIPANEGGLDVPLPEDAQKKPAGDLTVFVRFRKTTPENEPLGEFLELSLTSAGFQDIGGIASLGDKPGTIGVQRTASVLLQHFNRSELTPLLAHLAELYADVAGP